MEDEEAVMETSGGSPDDIVNMMVDDIDAPTPNRRHTLREQSSQMPAISFYGWGSTVDGELGLGGIEEQHVLSPTQIEFLDSGDIKYVACGEHHTLILTNSGMIYSCGNSDFGQLGRMHNRTKLYKISGLDSHIIVNIACGEYHSIAVNEWGQLFSWGRNDCGQLGLTSDSDNPVNFPKIVKPLATKMVIQVCCGYKHCLALLNDGSLYSWGSNTFGQLGIYGNKDNAVSIDGNKDNVVSSPTQITSLTGVPVAFIAAGGYHCFAISKTGCVYGWGKNEFGQLGLNHKNNQKLPTQLESLRTVGVKYIACGEDFSAFLTADGGVFTCGAGTYGQLGHGGYVNEVLPRKVAELMGSTVTQISCGRRHTLTLIPSKSRVYAFGLGGAGQLGNKIAKTASTPQIVLGPWLPNSHNVIEYTARRVYAGGDRCFVTVSIKKDNFPPEDCRIWDKNTQIWTITINQLEKCRNTPADKPVDQDLMTYLEVVMSSLSCWNGSFLHTSDVPYSKYSHGLNLQLVVDCFNIISKIEHSTILDTILTCISTAILDFPSHWADVEILRVYLILPFYHEFLNPKNCDILQLPFGEGLLEHYSTIQNWHKTLSDEHFELLILIYKNVFVDKLKLVIKDRYVSHWPTDLCVPLEVLEKLNKLYKGKAFYNSGTNRKIHDKVFHISELKDIVDIRLDYVKWVTDPVRRGCYFCNFPFMFDAETKTILLQTDQSMQMQDAINSATTRAITMFMSSLVPPTISQFLEIHVSRNNIVEDTIRELAEYTSRDLKKPLRVHFIGEEAEDAGGVRKEYFLLVLREILDPKYGMFKSYEETNAIWFHEQSLEDDATFCIVGVLCGLAIYNFTIINIPFPLAMYKKLLNELVDLEDIKDLSPTMYKSLQDILNYTDSNLEEVFNLSFEITKEIFGETKVIPLKPNGENIPVTLENKQEFVELYVDMVLNKSIENRFREFSEGFHKVCGGRVLQLFNSQELMSVVIGNEDYDWYELENNAEYKKEYSSSDPTIRMFWEVFHELSTEDKKKFLLYLTGSDRIPIQGMKAIKIIIQPTTDERYLPVAHTCFNLLDLPRYNTKERLRYKLLQAIQQTQGFSLV